MMGGNPARANLHMRLLEENKRLRERIEALEAENEEYRLGEAEHEKHLKIFKNQADRANEAVDICAAQFASVSKQYHAEHSVFLDTLAAIDTIDAARKALNSDEVARLIEQGRLI